MIKYTISTLLALSALTLSSPALAQAKASKSPAIVQSQSSEGTVEEQFCDQLGGLAESIMRGRQLGASFSDAMSVARNAGPEIRDITIALVRDAYNETRYTSATYQNRAVEDFRDKIVSACYRTMVDKT